MTATEMQTEKRAAERSAAAEAARDGSVGGRGKPAGTGSAAAAAVAVAAALLVPAAIVPAALSAQRNCAHRDEIELRGAAEGRLHVDAGAGKLEIVGSDGADEIRVTATLCASDRDRLAGLEVELDGHRLATDFPNRRGGWGRNYARIDLEIEVPRGTRVYVEDSSGSVLIEDVGDVEVQDGSGSMSLKGVGSVLIDDGSGSLRIEDAAGDVEIRDGSGSMSVTGVAGGVLIEDGSGSIVIEQVGGSVLIEAGSGGVTVRDVGGDLTVTDGRRARIRYSNIRGELDLPRARGRGKV